ncbi:hypothetical protein D770_16980 [Flammeovirgaceae bacterium 311]|nr:hypothetical protein D770_16980 [Flammeovirgaceae bacterium 311]
MAKLKNIIKQLSEGDYDKIYNSLMESSAEKSAYLLKAMREKHVSDNKIMDELDVNTNAYYTLRSRLNQKIEEYLLQQMENPRTDVLKKVANINEVIFTKKKAIAIATLKKLEKELLDYDLANELTVVYKTLKKLHVHSPEHFTYSQQYNQHVAYMLAVDKAEDLLVNYFRKYGEYTLTGGEIEKLELTLLTNEMHNVCRLYNSHRLYIYQSCLGVFHRLFVVRDESMEQELEPIEDILDRMHAIFEMYHLDTIYYHLRLVYEYLRLEYYNYYKVYRKAENFYEEVNESTAHLLTNYSLFTYPPQFLLTKVERHLRMGDPERMYEENEVLFQDFEIDKEDVSKYITYVTYRAISCYYAGKTDEASRWINKLLNDISLKKYPYAQLEIKTLLALQYCLMSDYDLFNQLINSIQRQIRLLGKDTCDHVLIFTKIMKIAISESKRNKYDKIKQLAERINSMEPPYFAPTKYIRFDETLLEKLAAL